MLLVNGGITATTTTLVTGISVSGLSSLYFFRSNPSLLSDLGIRNLPAFVALLLASLFDWITSNRPPPPIYWHFPDVSLIHYSNPANTFIMVLLC
ncbi:hypothetical protein HOY82DRAFT_619515 [Tuber indicum]|nr:hypothetical protein HOY82DRAFT_619515 [Tuber indicum]